MKPLTEPTIRAAFLNCTKGEAKRLYVPRDLAERPWDDLDLLGWRDPQAPDRAHLLAEVDGRPVGVVLRCPAPAAWSARRSICSLCITTHTGGVSLMVAPRAGAAGRQGNSVGTYICSDLGCSSYVRGTRDTGPGTRMPESLTLDERIARLSGNVAAFIAKVAA